MARDAADVVRGARQAVLVLLLLASTSVAVRAQEQSLRPLSDYLEHPGDEVATRTYVMRRCSALFSLVADQRRLRRDQATAEMYTDWSIGFRVHALRATLDSGWTAQEAQAVNEDAIGKLVDILRERIRRTIYIAQDPLLSSDVRTCRRLVDDLGI